MEDILDSADSDPQLGLLAQHIRDLSRVVGFSESALRFFLAVLFGYVLAIVPRNFFHHTPANVQHIYFTFVGLVLSYLIFGIHTLHYIITIVVNYALIAVGGGSIWSVVASFIINMTYYLVGTVSISDGTHDIKWDSPHCVMVLKVIGLAIDCYDGHKKKDELTREQKLNCVTKTPSLLETFGFCLFFGGFLAGPLFSMRRYLDFTDHSLIPQLERKNPSNVLPALSRFCFGVFYICLGITLNLIYPDKYFLTQEFMDHSLPHKLFVVYVWGQAFRIRYMAIWLFTEGVCIMSGLAYSGMDEMGKAQWTGSANVKIAKLETAVTFRDLVSSYNINTNQWAARCVYKRCKSLGNRHLSQFITLMFLALWHGIYIGYFHCFLAEMFCLNFEEQWQKVWRKLGLSRLWSSAVLYVLMSVVCNVFIMTSFAYSLVSFQLSYYPLFNQVYASMYYVGHVWYIGWTILFPFLIRPLLLGDKPTEKNKEEIKLK